VQKYLARRALLALGTLIGVSMIIFVVLRVLPGDPLVAILGVEGHARMLPADRVRIMADLGLSDPLPVQYVRWLRDIATGQLGKSFFRGDTVRDLILHRGPLSAEIAITFPHAPVTAASTNPPAAVAAKPIRTRAGDRIPHQTRTSGAITTSVIPSSFESSAPQAVAANTIQRPSRRSVTIAAR
jgi:hypothetical protein